MRVSILVEPMRIAVHALCRRPIRSALNAATTMVAIATVVTVMALISGSGKVAEHDMMAMGALTVQVHADPMAMLRGAERPLDDGELARVRAVVGSLAADVVEARTEQFSAQAGQRPAVLLPVVATRPGFLGMYDGKVTAGRWLTEEDVREARPVAALDAEAARALFGHHDVVGETIHVVRGRETFDLEVIGVLEDPFTMREQYEQFDTSQGARHLVARLVSFKNIHVPLTLLPDRPYSVIFARAHDRQGVRALGNAMRSWAEAPGHPLFVWSRGEWIDNMLSLVSDVSMLGAVIWALVLLVAMVMIFAVTTVSVRERYPEVAIRRTEGATRLDILVQFTVEGSLISSLGGIAGLGLGWASSHVLAGIVGWPPAFVAGDMLLALGLAVLVGLGATVLPARRAARLDPVAVLSRRRI